MLADFITLVIALAVLVKSSSYLVKSAAKIAEGFGVSQFVIGITLVAFGTSVPEFANTISSSLYHTSSLALGNILGSNILLMTLILGISAIIAPISIEKRMFYKEGLFVLCISLIFYALSANFVISRLEGAVLLLIFGAYILYLIETEIFRFSILNFLKQFVRVKEKDGVLLPEEPKTKREISWRFIAINAVIMVFSLVFLVLAASFVVPSAKNLAIALKVPYSVIGIVILAIGTTLPELAVSLQAVKHGQGNLLVGNILGSVIANTLLIIGTGSVISTIQLSAIDLYYFFPALFVAVFFLLLFIRTNWVVRMFEGLLLAIFYACFIALLVYFVVSGTFLESVA